MKINIHWKSLWKVVFTRYQAIEISLLWSLLIFHLIAIKSSIKIALTRVIFISRLISCGSWYLFNGESRSNTSNHFDKSSPGNHFLNITFFKRLHNYFVCSSRLLQEVILFQSAVYRRMTFSSVTLSCG